MKLKNRIKIGHLLLSLCLITGCCSEPILLKNGLTKEVNSVEVTNFIVGQDSLGEKVLDTFSRTTQIYDVNNLIIKRSTFMMFNEETMEIEYLYNDLGKLSKEVVTLAADTNEVDYIYMDTLLSTINSQTSNQEFEHRYVTTYKYDVEGFLNKTSNLELFKDKESGDTTTNRSTIVFYKEKDQIEIVITEDFVNPKKTRKESYKYDCGKLNAIKEYNGNGNLTKITKFRYVTDKHKNWIRRETEENEKLKFVSIREIEYR